MTNCPHTNLVDILTNEGWVIKCVDCGHEVIYQLLTEGELQRCEKNDLY